MPLSLETAIIFLMIFLVVDGVLCLTVWRMNPNLPGVGMVAFALLAFALAAPLVRMDGMTAIIFRNLLFNVSQVATCEGMALILNQKRLRWTPWAAAAFTLAVWPPMLIWIPEIFCMPLRVIIASLFTLLVNIRMIALIRRDSVQSRLWRTMTLSCLGILSLSVMVRAALSLYHLGTPLDVYMPQQGWFYFLIAVFVNTLFLCVIGAVGERRAHSLQEHNRTLAHEVELRERLANEATQALRDQMRMHDRRRQFLREIDHEISTPLAAIGRSAEMLELAPETLPSRLETIRNSVDRLSRLVDNLVTAEQVSLKQPHAARINAGELIAAAIQEVGGTFDISWPGPPVCFAGDPVLMRMALCNLLINALKFSPDARPPSILVESDPHTDTVRIGVRDHGIGFPPDEIEHVAQRGYRASNAGQVPGHGLGLHIVSQIMEMHQGQLTIANAEDGGGLVILELPTAPAA